MYFDVVIDGILGNTTVSATWEWREGRLLAYELILQFLIKNHWLYTFGAAGSLKSQHNSFSEEHRRYANHPEYKSTLTMLSKNITTLAHWLVVYISHFSKFMVIVGLNRRLI